MVSRVGSATSRSRSTTAATTSGPGITKSSMLVCTSTKARVRILRRRRPPVVPAGPGVPSPGHGGGRRMPGMTVLTARADVPTETPERYAKQLVSHLGRRTSWVTDGHTSSAEIAGGTGRVVVGGAAPVLIAEAPAAESPARLQHVLGSHPERFGQRNELALTWDMGSDPAGALTLPAPA